MRPKKKTTEKPSAFGALAVEQTIARVDQLRAKMAADPAPAPLARLTIHVDEEVADRVRRAVYFLPGMTVTKLARRALEAEVARLERANGGPFGEIPPGERVIRGRPPGRRG